MQLNPFLNSIAVPAAAKTVQTVVHVAHEAGQSFLKTLSNLRENRSESNASTLVQTSSAESSSVASQIQGLAGSFRQWLGELGISSPFEMQFSLAQNGDPIVNVVGPESEKIVDALYASDNWLKKFSALAERASEDNPSSMPGRIPSTYHDSAKLAISSVDAYVLRNSVHSF